MNSFRGVLDSLQIPPLSYIDDVVSDQSNLAHSASSSLNCNSRFEMASFANIDVTKINGAGVLAYESSDLAKTLGDAIAAKDAADANSALETVKALCEGCDQWIEPYMVECLPAIWRPWLTRRQARQLSPLVRPSWPRVPPTLSAW